MKWISITKYAKGDFCIHDNVLYKCSTAITTAEAWNAAHWTATTIGDELATTNDHIENKLKYIDINVTNDKTVQVNSASGGVISWTNFIGAYVIDTNSITAISYTYSNLIYLRLKNIETMVDASSGNYKVRCWYKGS